jgi:hypothetical protein
MIGRPGGGFARGMQLSRRNSAARDSPDEGGGGEKRWAREREMKTVRGREGEE